MRLRAPILAAFVPAVLVAGWVAFAGAPRTSAAPPGAIDQRPARAPQLAAIDALHPDNQPGADGKRPPAPAPAWGGRFTIHTELLPIHLNLALTSSAYARRIAGEVHAWLMGFDPLTLQLVPELAKSLVIEDTLTRTSGEPTVLHGRVEDGGQEWIVTAKGATTRVPKSDAASVAKSTVFTFRLRDDIRWHDGHPFDAHDVVFSWSIYGNPDVKCQARRWQYQKIVSAEALDTLTVRFVYAEQYFNALTTVGDMFLLPRHLYDPTDPDHAQADPEFHAARRAKDPAWKPGPTDVADCVNDNVHNRQFVGLGPYKLSSWSDDALEIERAPGWRAFKEPGYFDRVRWRRVADFGAAFRALVAGEVDFDDAVTSDDYFGSVAASPDFQRRFYAGTHRSQIYWFVGWNTRSPKLSDPRVRSALAHLADLEGYRQSYYRGLAEIMTGPFLPGAAARDPAIASLKHDIARAEQLLTEAGWIDRDADGIRDREGVALEIEMLVAAQNAPALAFAAKYQEDLARGGVRLKIQPIEQNVLETRKRDRQFEAVQAAWAVAPEADPEQTWHSRWAGTGDRSSNFVGLVDPEVDALIESGQSELDPARRAAIWHKLQARLMELQPYLFCYAPLRKFALLRTVRGFQETALDPNWNLRTMHYVAGTPGTRDAP